MEIAIVGVCSWGLCILERLLDRARSAQCPLAIHVIQPGPPGPGAHSPDEPEYLLMNTVCGQVSLFAAGEFSPGRRKRAGVTRYEWPCSTATASSTASAGGRHLKAAR